jgi:uncharacterized membrane protein
VLVEGAARAGRFTRPGRSAKLQAVASSSRAFARHDPRQARARLLIAVGVGMVVAFVLPARLGAALRAVAGWDAAALIMGALAWAVIVRAGSDPKRTRRHAADDDPGRRAVWVIAILASGFSMFATAVVLRGARVCAVEARPTFVVLCLVAVGSAWLLTHTAYTLRYAHLYYRDDGDGVGGLAFPGEGAPAYLDFAYFAFTIGMCFQTADVTVTNRQIRRAVMAHALLSFAYNTTILATAVSLIVGFFG